MRFLLRATAFPRTVYIMEALLTAGLLVGVRVLSRAVAESAKENTSPSKRVILIGAGAAAHTIIREIRRPDSSFVSVGCLGDDKSKLGMRIDNVREVGIVGRLEAGS